MAKRKKKSKGKKKRLGISDQKWANDVAKRTGTILQADEIPEGKMSEILLDYAEPMIFDFSDDSEERKPPVIEMACRLWNQSFINKEDTKYYGFLENMCMQIMQAEPFYLEPASALNYMNAMIKRKNDYFFWCNRIVVDKRIDMRNGGLYFSVISSEKNDKTPQKAKDSFPELKVLDDIATIAVETNAPPLLKVLT